MTSAQVVTAEVVDLHPFYQRENLKDCIEEAEAVFGRRRAFGIGVALFRLQLLESTSRAALDVALRGEG